MNTKPKMVKAWAYSYSSSDSDRNRIDWYYTRYEAVGNRKRDKYVNGLSVGPIVRIEVPAPVKARKGKS